MYCSAVHIERADVQRVHDTVDRRSVADAGEPHEPKVRVDVLNGDHVPCSRARRRCDINVVAVVDVRGVHPLVKGRHVGEDAKVHGAVKHPCHSASRSRLQDEGVEAKVGACIDVNHLAPLIFTRVRGHRGHEATLEAVHRYTTAAVVSPPQRASACGQRHYPRLKIVDVKVQHGSARHQSKKYREC